MKSLGRSNQLGFTIIEVLVATGLLGFLFLTILTTLNMTNVNYSKVRLTNSRNEIVNRIRRLSMNVGNMANSAIMTNQLGLNGVGGTTLPHYDMLARCIPSVLDAALSGCDKNEMDDAAKGNLFYLSSDSSLNPDVAVAGEKIYYTSDAARCSQVEIINANKCPIFARVWAEPHCLNFSKYCNKAISLTIRYSVGIRNDYSNNGQQIPPDLEGEVYLPIQKGIQIARVLDQNNNALTANSEGIYPLQKYLNLTDQGSSPRGIRFEVVVANPTGLVKLNMQMRSLTGVSVKGLDDTAIPAALENQAWADMPHPSYVSSQNPPKWEIGLVAAQPNQMFNFGTHNNDSTFFRIGAASTDKDINNVNIYPYYAFTINNGQLQAPLSFKSGFFQFRVIATDINGGKMESTNLVTARVFPRSQVIARTNGGNYSKDRDCVDNTLPISYYVTDDEGLKEQIVKVNGQSIGIGQVNGTSGILDFNFDLSQAAGNYPIEVISKDFSTQVHNILGTALPETKESMQITLNEVGRSFTLNSNPTQVRLNGNANVTATYSTGNCCNQAGNVSWTYPVVINVGAAMLSGNANSALACNVANGLRTCSSGMNVTGIKDGPANVGNGTYDVRASLNLGAQVDPACTLNGNSTGMYIPVLQYPSIEFYITESVWFDNIPNINSSQNNANKKAWVKISFSPVSEVKVKVIRADNNQAVCDITIPQGVNMNPQFYSCNIPDTYSGDLLIQRVPNDLSSKIVLMNEVPDANTAAKMETNLQHRVCSIDMNNNPNLPNKYTVPMELPMWNSPWGADANGSQYPQNDNSGNWDNNNRWKAGQQKPLKCFDADTAGWNNSGLNNSVAANPSKTKSVQDGFYAISRLNDGIATDIARYNQTMSIRFANFVFPNNGGPTIDFDSANIPEVYIVANNSLPSYQWKLDKGNGEVLTAQFEAMTDRTNSFCSGSAALSQLKIYSIKMKGYDYVSSSMKAVNRGAYSGATGGIQVNTPICNKRTCWGYAFICSYGNTVGHWNPVSR